MEKIREIIQAWIDERGLWNRLCEMGELFNIQDISTQTGIVSETLRGALRGGIEIRGGRNRTQHLCYIPETYAGSDSESTAKACLAKWFMNHRYKTYGSYGQEVSFREQGLRTICRLAHSGKTEDWHSLSDHLKRNGIDIVAFSESNKDVWIVELKGWTATSSDFNETIHQIFRHILDFYNCCGLPQNIRFACGFPYFREVPEWKGKFDALRNIPEDSKVLLHFSSATTVKKENGEVFLREFTRGPLNAAELMIKRKLLFLLIISPQDVRELLTDNRLEI